jgi:hypothetical protein
MDCSDWDGSYSAIVKQLRQSAANMARRRSEKNRDASSRYLAPANSTVRLGKQEPLSEVTLLPQRRLHNVKIYQCAPFSPHCLGLLNRPDGGRYRTLDWLYISTFSSCQRHGFVRRTMIKDGFGVLYKMWKGYPALCSRVWLTLYNVEHKALSLCKQPQQGGTYKRPPKQGFKPFQGT